MKRYDTITVTGITGYGHHGVFEHERETGQEFVVDMHGDVDARAAGRDDDLAATVHYGELAEKVHALITGDPVDLIETLAERISNAALSFAAAREVKVTVHKPAAPITVPFSDVSVTIHRSAPDEAVPPPPPPPPPTAQPQLGPEKGEAFNGANDTVQEAVQTEEDTESGDMFDELPESPVAAILALGANIGDAQQTLMRAISDISATAGIELVDVSPLARTAPVGPEQPDFFNCVVRVLTTLSARELLRAGNEIEAEHGRERLEHWGPRTLDIDIITYGNAVGMTEDLEIPHPRAHERAFVLAPWAELEPGAVLPGLGGGPVAVLAASAPDRPGIRWMSLDWLS